MQAIRDWIEFIFLMRFRYSPCAVADLLAIVTAVLQVSFGFLYFIADCFVKIYQFVTQDTMNH